MPAHRSAQTLAVAFVALAPCVLVACTSPAGAPETTAGSASALANVVRFQRGSGALRYFGAGCDEQADPRTHDTTGIRLDGLRPIDVIATTAPSMPGDPGGTNVILRIPGTSDTLTTQFFLTHGEDCYSGVHELRFDGGTVWRSIVDVQRGAATCVGACGGKSSSGCHCDDKCASHGDCCPDKVDVCGGPPAPSCAGACGARGSGACYCDDRCTRHHDCCGDYAPVCGPADLVGGSGITFPASGEPSLPGEDVSAGTVLVRYDYHRLIDAHPSCIEHAPDGSAARIVMEVNIDGQAPFVKRFVAGYSTSPSLPLTIEDTFDVPASTRFRVAFRCGTARDDRGGAGYVFQTIR